MANITISGLPTRGTVLDTTLFPTQTGGVTEKVSGQSIKNYISAIEEINSPGDIHADGNVTAGISMVSPVIGSNTSALFGVIQDPIQTNITKIGTINDLAVVGNLTLNGGSVVSEGAAATFAAINATPIGNSAPSTGGFTTITSESLAATGNISGLNGVFNTVTATTVRALGSVTAGSNVSVDIGSAGTWFRNSWTRAGNYHTINSNVVTAVTTTSSQVLANTVTVNTSIVPSANIAVDIGSTSQWFRTVYGVSVQAQYADLAEKYTVDYEYEPGTVLVFGGEAELTKSTVDHDPAVAGVISTNPAYLMNSQLSGLTTNLAMTGRVPCLVQGPVKKGDRLVSGVNGTAIKMDESKYSPGCGIGYAIEEISSSITKKIEIMVSKF